MINRVDPDQMASLDTPKPVYSIFTLSQSKIILTFFVSVQKSVYCIQIVLVIFLYNLYIFAEMQYFCRVCL